MQSKYDAFRRNVEKAAEIEDSVNDDRPPLVEVIHLNNKLASHTISYSSNFLSFFLCYHFGSSPKFQIFYLGH